MQAEERAKKSLLDGLGSELISILSPVSACMLLVVILVRTLSVNTPLNQLPSSTIATIAYSENPSDSTAHKLEGALLNALIFVAFVTLTTFLFVALFYFRCNRCLRIYLSVSVFNVLVYFGALVAVQLIQVFSIPVDIVAFCILFFNFGVVGVLVVFPFMPVPIVFTQGYLVMVAMLVAFWFTYLPEWTTWALLLGLAVYDVVAVLLPGGPLNLLIQLAMKREQELPALIYECRPTVPENVNPGPNSQQQMRRWRRRLSSAPAPAPDADADAPGSPPSGSFISRMFGGGVEYHTLTSPELEQQTLIPTEPEREREPGRDAVVSVREVEVVAAEEDESFPLMENRGATVGSLIGNEERAVGAMHDELTELQEQSSGEDEAGRIESTVEGGLKLGLGDFIFYSLLVGRAAMFDLMTVGVCYLAIVAGLGVTLMLLAVWRRALPALPVSISLGVLFYFLTRLVVEPLVLQLDTALVFF